jgi:dTDP-4-dehydrorhamnose reductase
MSQTILVNGAGGRLGAALVRTWKYSGEDVIGLNRADLDLSRPEQIRDILENLDFGVLVNCAAQTNVDRCETHPEEAMQINALAAREIATVCAEKGARCIHISTDYVFDGEKGTPYTEEDQAEPISRYGESKLAGEFAVLDVSDRNLVVRVSWVFGPDRPSFVDAILQKARTEEKVAAIARPVFAAIPFRDASRRRAPFVQRRRLLMAGIRSARARLRGGGGDRSEDANG